MLLSALLACSGPSPSSPAPPPIDPSIPSVPAPSPPTTEPAPSSSPPNTTAEPIPFSASFATEYAGSAIALRSNLPGLVDGCLAIPDAPCDDLDADGLVDLWEEEALERLRPAVQFDESEPLIDDPDAVFAMVGRVTLVDGDIHVYIMLGYHYDYGRCALSFHDGDSERVAIKLAWMTGPTDNAGDAIVVATYTAAHENTLTDGSTLYEDSDMLSLSFPLDPPTGEPRWLVWASDGKHATYGSIDACESASFVPCIEEDCAPDGVSDPLPFTVLPAVVNAGEPDAPLLTDLSSVGFPDEDAWAEQDFCGGRGRGPLCSAPVRDKLTVDPF